MQIGMKNFFFFYKIWSNLNLKKAGLSEENKKISYKYKYYKKK